MRMNSLRLNSGSKLMGVVMPLLLMLMLMLANGARGREVDPAKVLEGEDWVSGVIDLYGVNEEPTDDIFYLLVRCRNKTRPAPLLIWIQGGPACSDFLGLYMEIGPHIFNLSGKYVYNPYAWNEVADVLYVDQPPSVGFSNIRSKASYCRNLTCVGKDMYRFLLKFVNVYPEYQGRPLYIVGQSYGGQYIPGIAGYLARAKNPLLNLKGIGIGNGIVNLQEQVGTYPIFGYENHLVNFTFGRFLSYQTDSWLCEVALLLQIRPLFYFCNQAYLQIRYNLPNSNDIRRRGGYPQPGLIDRYMADENIHRQLGISRKYLMCNTTLNESIYDMYYTYTLQDLTDVLEAGVQVLLYYGNKDAVCNWRGGERIAETVPWPGRQGFSEAQYRNWTIAGRSYGRLKRHDNLAFLIIDESGHYVPVDQPFFALQMVQKFMFDWSPSSS